MIIIRDTREQAGYDFACITPPPVVNVATLTTGDYSLKGLENQITIERKNLSDAFGTFGRGRARWERELERMAGYQFAAVVIEADWHTIVRRPPARSRLNPRRWWPASRLGVSVTESTSGPVPTGSLLSGIPFGSWSGSGRTGDWPLRRTGEYQSARNPTAADPGIRSFLLPPDLNSYESRQRHPEPRSNPWPGWKPTAKTRRR